MKRPSASSAAGTSKKRSAPKQKPAVGSKFDTLQREIIARSEADEWIAAKTEWSLAHVYRAESSEPGCCLCTQYPILEICTLENENTGHEAVVGNCCVKRFMDLPSDTIFSAIRRISQDSSKSLNAQTLDFAYERSWITDWENDFYLDTLGKRRLTERQEETRERINDKVVARMTKPAGADENAWEMEELDIKQAREDGKITVWEEHFYLGNMGRGFVTEKQLPIKERIEAKMNGTWKHESLGITWACERESIDLAMSSGRINERDGKFYTEMLGSSSLSEKQIAWKQTIEQKVAQSFKAPQHHAEAGDVLWKYDSEAIARARASSWITENDAKFYMDKIGRKSLSPKQLSWKEGIEVKIARTAIAEIPKAGSRNSVGACESRLSSGSPLPAAQTFSAEQKARMENNRRAALERKWHLQKVRDVHREGKLGTWEIGFYEDIFMKMVEGVNLSERQCLHRDRIHQGILAGSMQ